MQTVDFEDKDRILDDTINPLPNKKYNLKFWKSYFLNDRSNPRLKGERKLDWMILGIWILVVFILALLHEPWRDEVRALSLAMNNSFGALLGSALRNEGHPVLWYLILKGVFTLTQSTFALKISSLLVAWLAVGLFYFYAPFPRWMKIMFLFSILPLYLYSVMARNYGLSMLFIFLIAIELSRKKPLTFFLGIWLVLLANSNLHSIPIAALFLIYWNSELLIKKYKFNESKAKWIVVYTNALAILGILYAIWTVLPGGDSSVGSIKPLNWAGFTSVLQAIIPHPGYFLDTVFHVDQVWIRDFVVLLLFMGLLRHYRLALVFILSVEAFNLIFGMVYQGYYRHQGLILVLALALYWISFKKGNQSESKYAQLFNQAQKYVFLFLIPLILLFHLRSSQVLVWNDVKADYSGSKQLASFLESNDELKNAILISEPDYFIESLPYYSKNKIYFPRKGEFNNTVSFDTVGIEKFTLNALLDSAIAVQQLSKKPVLLLFGFPEFGKVYLSDQDIHYNRLFSWTEEEMNRFDKEAVFMNEISGALYENFKVYRLRDH